MSKIFFLLLGLLLLFNFCKYVLPSILAIAIICIKKLLEWSTFIYYIDEWTFRHKYLVREVPFEIHGGHIFNWETLQQARGHKRLKQMMKMINGLMDCNPVQKQEYENAKTEYISNFDNKMSFILTKDNFVEKFGVLPKS